MQITRCINRFDSDFGINVEFFLIVVTLTLSLGKKKTEQKQNDDLAHQNFIGHTWTHTSNNNKKK